MGEAPASLTFRESIMDDERMIVIEANSPIFVTGCIFLATLPLYVLAMLYAYELYYRYIF